MSAMHIYTDTLNDFIDFRHLWQQRIVYRTPRMDACYKYVCKIADELYVFFSAVDGRDSLKLNAIQQVKVDEGELNCVRYVNVHDD